MSTVIICILVMAVTGILAALLLWGAGKRFHVDEDPRIDAIEALLPGANCGGCGRSGCREFASACVKADSLTGLTCPGSPAEVMDRIADIVGLKAEAVTPQVAVLACGGTCEARPLRAVYDGVESCAVMRLVSAGARDCAFGCLGCGDCVRSCPFGAMRMDPTTGLPVIDEAKCTGCGVCTRTCPRSILHLRPHGPRGLRVWVACSNTLKGTLAMKDCRAACIGCGKCLRTCPHGAITVSDNLARIDPAPCKLCRKCVAVCPTGAIHTSGFPLSPQSV